MHDSTDEKKLNENAVTRTERDQARATFYWIMFVITCGGIACINPIWLLYVFLGFLVILALGWIVVTIHTAFFAPLK